MKRNIASAIETQIANYLRMADFRMYGLQQRAIAASNAQPSPANFVNAIVRDSIFPQSSSGPVKTTSTGVVKYGRRGEYVLHIGVDEEVSHPPPPLSNVLQLFPDQPPANVSNKQREKIKAKSKSATRQATGSADQFKKSADQARSKGQQEANDLDARKKEQQRRESKSEGWRSNQFDV